MCGNSCGCCVFCPLPILRLGRLSNPILDTAGRKILKPNRKLEEMQDEDAIVHIMQREVGLRVEFCVTQTQIFSSSHNDVAQGLWTSTVVASNLCPSYGVLATRTLYCEAVRPEGLCRAPGTRGGCAGAEDGGQAAAPIKCTRGPATCSVRKWVLAFHACGSSCQWQSRSPASVKDVIWGVNESMSMPRVRSLNMLRRCTSHESV